MAEFIGPSCATAATSAVIHLGHERISYQLLCGELSSSGLSVWAQQGCTARVLVTGINRGPLPGHRDLYPSGSGWVGREEEEEEEEGGLVQEIWMHPPPTHTHTPIYLQSHTHNL